MEEEEQEETEEVVSPEPAEAEEADQIEAEDQVEDQVGAVPETGVHATQMHHPARPVTSIGVLGKELGIVQTGMDVLGETMKVQNLDTTETLQQQKKQIENLTNSTQVLTHLIPYTETRK